MLLVSHPSIIGRDGIAELTCHVCFTTLAPTCYGKRAPRLASESGASVVSESTGVIRCPICRQLTLNVGVSAQGTPPMVMVIDGVSRLLKPISCSTCTSIWFIYGEVNQIDWDEINRMTAEHDDRRSS
jgi:hypothetical protein